MIGISKLYCNSVEASDPLRYGRRSQDLPAHLLQFSRDKKPVIIWNITQRCNLNCRHCYAKSLDAVDPEYIDTCQAKVMLEDLANFGVPVILFSGGEPLLRQDLSELVETTVQNGMRAVISTNGTLITRKKARELKSTGLSYVGISIDGMQEVHDRFRRVDKAFDMAIQGLRNCQMEGLKVGLRFTINKQNFREIPQIFELVEQMEIPRICFYHLVYSGRGSELIKEDLSLQESRATVDLIIDKTWQLFEKKSPAEVLTVDNHADGPYLYLRLLRENPARAREVLKLLRLNGGNSSGLGIGCISWDGEVYADQFWRNHSFGNVLQTPFSSIWQDPEREFLGQLKNKKDYVKGRCANCNFLDLCAGNLRARAEAYYGDVWAPDPACYLTDQEIRQPVS